MEENNGKNVHSMFNEYSKNRKLKKRGQLRQQRTSNKSVKQGWTHGCQNRVWVGRSREAAINKVIPNLGRGSGAKIIHKRRETRV